MPDEPPRGDLTLALAPPPARPARSQPAVRFRRTDLKLTDDACPHCDGALDYWRRVGNGSLAWRCRKCRCKWDPFGWLKVWGASCPLYTRA